MIQINKSKPPIILSRKGAKCRKEDCRAFDENNEDYQNGTRTFKFNRNIYSHDTVKESLQKSQHGKCCYCEERFGASSYGDVEHYRPKGAVRQSEDEPRLYPGYYWLAYSWENLYYCCHICNNSKKEVFPLMDPEHRVRSHNEDINVEKPLIVDPGGPENPRNHIGYRGNVAYGKSEVGRKTIEIVRLNRDKLLDERLKHLKPLESFLNIMQLANNQIYFHESIKKFAYKELQKATESTAKFSAMVLDNLKGGQIV